MLYNLNSWTKQCTYLLLSIFVPFFSATWHLLFFSPSAVLYYIYKYVQESRVKFCFWIISNVVSFICFTFLLCRNFEYRDGSFLCSSSSSSSRRLVQYVEESMYVTCTTRNVHVRNQRRTRSRHQRTRPWAARITGRLKELLANIWLQNPQQQ